jgi:hypothetical protein
MVIEHYATRRRPAAQQPAQCLVDGVTHPEEEADGEFDEAF